MIVLSLSKSCRRVDSDTLVLEVRLSNTMTESDSKKDCPDVRDVKNVPIVQDSRLTRIKRIVEALSDFEQDEIAYEIQSRKVKKAHAYLADLKNLIRLSLFTGLIAGAAGGILTGFCIWFTALSLGGTTSIFTLLALSLTFGAMYMAGTSAFVFVVLKLLTLTPARNLIVQSNKSFRVQKVEVPVPINEGVELSLTALAAKRGWRIQSINRQEGTISAQTAASLRSPGELVGIKVDSLTEDSSMVSIYSKPILTSMDFGKSGQNVSRLAKEIEEAGLVHQLLKMQ